MEGSTTAGWRGADGEAGRRRVPARQASCWGLLLVAGLAAGAAAWLVLTPLRARDGDIRQRCAGFVRHAHWASTGSGGRGAQPVSPSIWCAGSGMERSRPVCIASTIRRRSLRFMRRIARGDVFTKSLTVPEGANIFDIAARVEQAGLGTRQDFLDAAVSQTESGGRFGPRSEESRGLPVSGHLPIFADRHCGADRRRHGAAVSRGGRAIGIEGKRASVL